MHQNPERRVDAGMKRIPVHQLIQCKKVSCLLALAAAFSVLFSTTAQPVELEHGDLSLALDTTVSYGLTWRLDDRWSSPAAHGYCYYVSKKLPGFWAS